MSYYRIIFARNHIISCTETDSVPANEIPHYEHKHGQMIFALVEAGGEEEARAIALKFVAQLKETSGKPPGQD